jgi:hypothetical protein
MIEPVLLAHVRACLADAERAENSLETRLDAAVQAAAYLDQAARQDPVIQDYLVRKYDEPLEHFELLGCHAYAVALAKKLLSQAEQP